MPKYTLIAFLWAIKVMLMYFSAPAQVKNRLAMPHPLKLECYEKWTAPINDLWSRDHYRAAFNKQNIRERSPEIHVFLG